MGGWGGAGVCPVGIVRLPVAALGWSVRVVGDGGGDGGGLGRGCVNGGTLERGVLKGFIGGTMY